MSKKKIIQEIPKLIALITMLDEDWAIENCVRLNSLLSELEGERVNEENATIEYNLIIQALKHKGIELAEEEDKTHKGKNLHPDHETNPDAKQCYYKVSLIEYPEFGYLDTLEGILETLKYNQSEEEGTAIVITTKHLTKKEFDQLPEFEGF